MFLWYFQNFEIAEIFYKHNQSWAISKYLFDNPKHDVIKDVLLKYQDIDLDIPFSTHHSDSFLHDLLTFHISEIDEQIIQLILNCGADVNLRNSKGKTPFLIACQNASPKIIKKFIEYGASHRIKTDSRQSCLSFLILNFISTTRKNEKSEIFELIKYFVEDKEMSVTDFLSWCLLLKCL